MVVLLIVCLLLIAYVYAGYPLWMAWRAWKRISNDQEGLTNDQEGRRLDVGDRTSDVGCRVSVVIAVYNDALLLKEKVRGMLATEGAWIGEVLVGSDGSTDGVAQVLAELGDERVRVIEFAERRGKTAVLNEVVPQCRHDLVVLMDARQRVVPGSVEALVSRFEDEQVGVVSGELVFGKLNDECRMMNDDNTSSAAEGMGAYWQYEKWIRKNEARAGSVPGATGACYAMRKCLFRRIPNETILDDVAYPMMAVMQGYRCVFEEKAVVLDRPSIHSKQESVRKRRTLAGNVQLLQLFPELLLPRKNPIWFSFLSHKILRLLVPFLGVLAVFSAIMSVFVEKSAFLRVFSMFFLIFCAFFAVFCLFGAFYEKKGLKNRIFSLCWMFFVLNRVTLLGVVDGVRGKYRVMWDKAYEK